MGVEEDGGDAGKGVSVDSDDQIDIIEAFLAIHSALATLGAKLPPHESLEFQNHTNTLLNVCRTMLDRRKAQKPQGLLGIIQGAAK